MHAEIIYCFTSIWTEILNDVFYLHFKKSEGGRRSCLPPFTKQTQQSKQFLARTVVEVSI